MPNPTLAKALILPELKLLSHKGLGLFVCDKVSALEVCPKCAKPSGSIYDHRWVTLKDAPIQDRLPTLRVLKRRFYCQSCRKPFTEPLPGVLPGRRTTQRFRAAVLTACQEWHSLSLVRRKMRISSGLLYRIQYEQLELRRRMNNHYPWPERIGLDEHGFGKDPLFRRKRFVTMVVNQSRGKLMEVVPGKSSIELQEFLKDIPGRENVRWVTMDMCDPYRNFIREFFPQEIIQVLVDGSIDLGYTYEEARVPFLKSVEVFSDEIIHVGVPRIAKERPPFIRLKGDQAMEEWARKSKWSSSQPQIEVDQMALLISLLLTGMGTGFVPRRFVKGELLQRKLIEIKLPSGMRAPKRTVYAVFRVSHNNRAEIAKFIEASAVLLNGVG